MLTHGEDWYRVIHNMCDCAALNHVHEWGVGYLSVKLSQTVHTYYLLS
jgi:hypothetical protein